MPNKKLLRALLVQVLFMVRSFGCQAGHLSAFVVAADQLDARQVSMCHLYREEPDPGHLRLDLEPETHSRRGGHLRARTLVASLAP